MNWRETEADQLEVLVTELDFVLDRVYVAEQILDRRGRTAGAAEARSFASLLRSEINSLNAEARELRRTDEQPVFPMSITSRRRSG